MSRLPSKPARPIGSSSKLPGIFRTTPPARLQSLFADFARQKHSNPESYGANVQWWKKALSALPGEVMAPEDQLSIAAGRELSDKLRVEGVGRPLALGAIFTELRQEKAFLPLASFISAKESIYDPGWLPSRIAAYVVGKPMWWALEQLGVVSDDVTITDKDWWGDYVVVERVERAAEAVLERQSELSAAGPSGALFTFATFRVAFSDVENPLSERDVKVLLKFLERDKKAIVVDKQVIKFVDSVADAEQRQITSVDHGILELKNAVQGMHAQVDAIQLQIDDRNSKINAALGQQRKSVALSTLRSRKQLEDVLSKRLGSLEVLQSSLITVESAAGNVELMRIHESSSNTLRSLLAHPSLQRDKIDETMEALAEVNSDAREIDEAIRIGGDVAVGVSASIDEDELEAELQQLVAEAQGKPVPHAVSRPDIMRTENAEAEKVQQRLNDKALRPPKEVVQTPPKPRVTLQAWEAY